MTDETFRIKSSTGDDLIVTVAEYKKLRNKIKFKMEQFYEGCTFKDAGIDDSDILFFCTVYGKQVIKRFNVGEWIEAERSGKFNDKYYEFTQRGKRSSVKLGDLVGSGDSKFRKKRSF